MVLAERSRNFNELLHRVIAALNHSRTEEETFDVVALVELQREGDNFLRSEPCPRSIAGNAIHAVRAVVNAVIREEDLQQRDAPAIGRIAVANSNPAPFPMPPSGRFRFEPLLAQDASYLAASARMRSFDWTSTKIRCRRRSVWIFY